MFLAVDLALFFNSYVNPIALEALGWKYYSVYDLGNNAVGLAEAKK